MSDFGDWWKRKFQRMDEAARLRYQQLLLEQQIGQINKPTRPMLRVQQAIVAAAKPLIEAGEKNPTAKLLDVWKNIPGQGAPKNKKEIAGRKRQIRRWTAHLK
jgi:hypothetical protein